MCVVSGVSCVLCFYGFVGVAQGRGMTYEMVWIRSNDGQSQNIHLRLCIYMISLLK